MIKVASSLILPALLVGAMVLHPSSACPYLAQQQDGGRDVSMRIGTAQHPAVRKLQVTSNSDKEGLPTSLNHQRRLQAFDIFSFITSKNIQFFPQGLVMCFYGIFGLIFSLFLVLGTRRCLIKIRITCYLFMYKKNLA